jgi:hypothetical protein
MYSYLVYKTEFQSLVDRYQYFVGTCSHKLELLLRREVGFSKLVPHLDISQHTLVCLGTHCRQNVIEKTAIETNE